MTSTRKITYRPVRDVVQADRNPKSHDLSALSASIARFGFIEPIVEDGRTGQLLAGHGRLSALAALEVDGAPPPDGVRVVGGKWCVPIVSGWASNDAQEASAALVAVNRISEAGGWDDAELAVLLAGLDDLDGVGFSDVDLESLLASTTLPDDLDAVVPFNPAPTSDDYYTPSWVFETLGINFDIDVCSPPEPQPWIPAKRRFTEVDDGLTQLWVGSVWMNPPYSNPTPWMEKFREHANGVALVPCSKGRWFVDAWCDPRLVVVSTPANMKFMGGGISYHTVFMAAGECRTAVANLGTARGVI